MEELTTTLVSYGIDLLYVLSGLLVLTLGKIVKDILTPYKVDEELTIKDNPALGVSIAGYYAAVIAVFVGAMSGGSPLMNGSEIDTTALLKDLMVVIGYSLGGIVLLNISRFLVDKLMLYKFSVTKEIITDRNAGSGAVECGNYIASGLVIAGAVHGEGGGPVTTLAFYVAGQATLLLYGLFYQLITSYDIHKEIEEDNVPAGVAMGGNLIAIGIIMLKSLKGDFIDWGTNLENFLYSAVLGFIFLMIIRFTLDWMLLPKSTLTHEIAEDRNLSAAYIESVVLMGTATVIFFAL